MHIKIPRLLKMFQLAHVFTLLQASLQRSSQSTRFPWAYHVLIQPTWADLWSWPPLSPICVLAANIKEVCGAALQRAQPWLQLARQDFDGTAQRLRSQIFIPKVGNTLYPTNLCVGGSVFWPLEQPAVFGWFWSECLWDWCEAVKHRLLRVNIRAGNTAPRAQASHCCLWEPE